MFTIPDDGEPLSPNQATLFQEDLEVLVAAIDGKDCVLSGLACTQQGSPDMTVAVAKGSVLTNGVLKAVAAANATIGAASAAFPRIDLIVINSSGAIAVRAGTAAETPKPPTRTANDVVICQVFVPTGATTVITSYLNDRRMLRRQGPIVIDSVSTPVSNSNTSAQQTYYTLVVPNGLFLAGRRLRFDFRGSWGANSGSPTLTVAFAYGGTTMYSDTGDAYVADADVRQWSLQGYLYAQGNSDQRLGMTWVGISASSAVPTPTTGVGGFKASPFAINMAGDAAVDSDAADCTFTFKVTMSVANAADVFTLEFATVWLE